MRDLRSDQEMVNNKHRLSEDNGTTGIKKSRRLGFDLDSTVSPV